VKRYKKFFVVDIMHPTKYMALLLQDIDRYLVVEAREKLPIGGD